MNGQGSYGLKFYIALINITQKTQTVADGNFVDCKTVRIFLSPQGSRTSRTQDSFSMLYWFLYWFWEKTQLFCSLVILGLFKFENFFFDTPILKNVLPDSLIRVQTTLQYTGNLWNDEPLTELNIAWKIFWYLYFTKINFHPSLQMYMNELVSVPQPLNSADCS